MRSDYYLAMSVLLLLLVGVIVASCDVVVSFCCCCCCCCCSFFIWWCWIKWSSPHLPWNRLAHPHTCAGGSVGCLHLASQEAQEIQHIVSRWLTCDAVVGGIVMLRILVATQHTSGRSRHFVGGG